MTSYPPATEASLYRQSVDGAMAAVIGAYGLGESELAPWQTRAANEVRRLADEATEGSLALLGLPAATEDITAARVALESLSVGARTIVFLGTGGSALGGKTLAQLAGWNVPGFGDERQRGRPRTRFYDNLDPDTLARALDGFDLATTRFVVTSKSGGTPETLAQAIAVIDALKRAGREADIGRQMLFVTEPRGEGRNGLRDLADAFAVPCLDHHPGVGGRFSVLTNVGLIPAMARGLDPVALRAGAGRVLAEVIASASSGADATLPPPALGAAVAVALSRSKGIRVQVMMPYADRLASLGHWFAQLWAESLGKGGVGTTPVACVGPLDQHSQLQLFMDGPREHVITIIRIARNGEGPRLDDGLARLAGLDAFAGRTIGDIVTAQSHAVPEALARAGRPVRTFDLPRLDEEVMGAMLMHFMLETIIAGRLMGVDPFDQPAVELAKVLTRERMAATATR
ncbi:MAG: glucose-6-phosphate isomerase [Hyphomicrobiaceae bacterium]